LRNQVFALAVVVAAFARPALAQDAQPQDPHAWPRTFAEADGTQFTVYQPQLEQWNQVDLTARAAVAAQPSGASEPVYGVVWFSAHTDVDKEQRLVALQNIHLANGKFPTAPDSQQAWLDELANHFPDHCKTVSLDRLAAAYAAVTNSASAGAAVNNDPPRIIFSTTPSILVLVDGNPTFRAATGGLQRLINSRALIFRDENSGIYFLAAGGRWLTARSLDGPWGLAPGVPEGAEQMKSSLSSSGQVDLYEGDEQLTNLVAGGTAPAVYTSTDPAELIETYGDPDLTPIAGTELLWVKNTAGYVIVDTSTNVTYVLASGRWFCAPSRNGPWAYCAGNALPPDFGRIPAGSPAAEVLSSVPGTAQAQEAVIENDIPQTAEVTRSDATLTVDYDGTPDLEPVEGTTIRYVQNCSIPVVLVEGRYYACHDGVWFASGALTSGWVVCDAVPTVIYSIPVSCPIHYCTYVRVYRATAGSVWCGYTPGYLGTCRTRDGCVVWGTGFRHRPWIGRTTWIGRPCTYGFGCSVHACSTGFGVGIGVTSRVVTRPWWGPLSRPSAAFEAHRTERFDIHVNNTNVYHNWHAGVRADVHAEVRAEHRVEEHRAVRAEEHREAVRANNVYATKNGQVFRRSDDGKWEQHTQGAWKAPAPSVTPPRQQQVQHRQLEVEHQARERGNERAVQVQRPAPAPAPRPQPVHQVVHAPPVAPGLRGGSTHHH
jgi:hypothetical protein